MALAFSSPAFWWSLGIVIFGLYYFARIINVRWRPALWLRWGVAGLVVLGIFATRADWRIDPLPTRQVLLVDISHSIAEEEMINMQEKVENWMNIDKNRIVVWVGADAQVNQQLDNLEIDQRASNLPAGLQLAIDILGDNPGIVTLASDGVTDYEFDTQQIVMRMQAEGHTLNVVSLNTLARPNDLYLGDIQVPAGVWAQVSFEVEVLVFAPTAGTAFLDLVVDGEVLESRSVSVVPGENIVSFVLQASGEQILTIEARGTWQGDQFLDNNQSYAAIRVFSVPKVLLVSKIGLSATNFDRALGNEGIMVDRINPKNFPINLSQFEDYQVIVLNNVAALDLNFEQVQALKVFVSKGGGLLVLGGRDAYTLGGYQNTELSKLLPVEMTAPSRGQRAPITFVMVLDRSASMSEGRGPYLPIDMAREAAVRTLENLRAEDHIGVLTFTYPGEFNYKWDVPIRLLGDGLDLRSAQDAVSRIEAGGGTFMYRALVQAVDALLAQRPTDNMHILLLTDGRSQDGSEGEFQSLAARANGQGITISTISLGTNIDPEILALIADIGGGRFLEVPDPTDLPQIMIAESQAALSENTQPGQTSVVLGVDGHPVMSGFSPADLPGLDGYHALVSKSDQGAEDILISASFGDPILSVWQYGLGRVATWTGDLGQDWANQWKSWGRRGEFWGQVLRYTLPDPGLDNAQVDLSVGLDEVTLNVYLQNETGGALNQANPTYQFVDEDNTVTSYPIPQIGVGQYQLSFPTPPQGAYRGTITHTTSNGQVVSAAPLVVNYPTEWQTGDADAGFLNLLRWAQITGGSKVEWGTELTETAPTVQDNFDLIDLLLLVLVILWPIEIAIRRRKMPWP